MGDLQRKREADFAKAWAEAVVWQIREDRPHEVYFVDGVYEVGEVASGCSPTDVDLWVGSTWRQLVPGLPPLPGPSEPTFRHDAFINALSTNLIESGTAAKLAAMLADKAQDPPRDIVIITTRLS